MEGKEVQLSRGRQNVNTHNQIQETFAAIKFFVDN